VAAEDLLVHDGGDGEAVEAVGERLPQLDVESAFTCKTRERAAVSGDKSSALFRTSLCSAAASQIYIYSSI